MYNDEACQVRKQVDWVFDSRSRPGHYPLVFGHTRRAAYRLLRQRRLEDPRWVHMLKLCNPKVMRKVGLEVELVKLDKLWAAHCQSQRELRFTLSTLPGQIAWREREIAGHQAALARRGKCCC